MTQPAEQCCVCGSSDVTYHNYREQPFCWPCANCRCGLSPCVRETLYKAAQPVPVSGRIPLDHLNSNQLDQLYNRAEKAEAERDALIDERDKLDQKLTTMTDVARGNLKHVQTIVPELEAATQRAEQLQDLLRIAHDTSNTSEAERARAVERAKRAETELAGARATIAHMTKAMGWICGHDRQGLDHLEEAQREGRSRESAVTQARRWASRARNAEAAIERVRAIHTHGLRTNTCNDCGQPWPCEVTHALDGEQPATQPPHPQTTKKAHRLVVKESTRRYAEQLRAKPGKASADGHTGWECTAGASLIAEATTPGPGRLGTLHATIYICPDHRAAAEERITTGGYTPLVEEAPFGHRWDPWPCGHLTAHKTGALDALGGEQPASSDSSD